MNQGFLVGKENWDKATKINNFCDLNLLKKIREKLSNEQLKLFKKGIFGQFTDIK